MEFDQFVVGEKNKIQVALRTEEKMHNKYNQRRLHWIHSEVHLLCENDLYPARISIDFKKILKQKNFTFDDLNYILPRGLEVDTSKHKTPREPIVKVPFTGIL